MSARAAVAIGGASAAAVAVWLLAQLHVTLGMGLAAIDVSAQSARALLLVEALLAALVVPQFAARRWSGALPPFIAIQLVTLPLLSFFWLTGVTARPLLVGTLCVSIAAVAIAFVARGAATATADPHVRSVAVAALQIGGCAAAWYAHPAWMQWLGV